MKWAALVLLGGCTSLIAAHGPGPSGADDPPVRCSSLAWPVIDVLLAVPFAIGARSCDSEVCGLGSVGAAATAAFALASATYGVGARLTCDAARDHQASAKRDAAIPHEREVLHEQAWKLMQPAALAARNGDCATVIRVDTQLHELDADFHAAVFVRDVAIAHCLSMMK